jgi:hypothetical protein
MLLFTGSESSEQKHEDGQSSFTYGEMIHERKSDKPKTMSKGHSNDYFCQIENGKKSAE